MMIQFDKAKWSQDSEGFWLSLRVKVPALAKQFVASIQERIYDAELKQHREKRSLDANGYLWVLCREIAIAVRNITKEEVYQEAVKKAGQFEPLVFKNDSVETFIHRWSGHGLGWFAEPLEGSIPEYTQVIAYYGSSVYDTREMSVLLDYVVNLAKDLGIETATPDELEKMESTMGRLKSKQAKACDIPKSVKDAVWERDGHRCIICDNPAAMPNAHYIPRSHGGLGVEENIVTLCIDCHRTFDQSISRSWYREKIKAYLLSHYPGWDEKNLIYHKYSASGG